MRHGLTAYHPKGSLDRSHTISKGRPLEALQAFRQLVEGVAILHHKRIVHRDIKPQNIFLAEDGKLVLGDMGFVYLPAALEMRKTQTFDNVGTRDWMPPWSVGRRIMRFTPVLMSSRSARFSGRWSLACRPDQRLHRRRNRVCL